MNNNLIGKHSVLFSYSIIEYRKHTVCVYQEINMPRNSILTDVNSHVI